MNSPNLIKNKINKAILIALFVAFLLSSCSMPNEEKDHTDNQQGNQSTPSESPSASQDPPAPSEPQKQKEEEIAEFISPLKDKNKNRMQNIRLSSEKINGKIIPPGEIFSFNETVGKRTLQKGYKKAIIFRNKEKVKEVGGGICQVSTAIYNAALAAELEIVERHEHQLDVPYIEKGRDATVSYGHQDFRFKNSTESQLKMAIEVTEDDVICRIFKINE